MLKLKKASIDCVDYLPFLSIKILIRKWNEFFKQQKKRETNYRILIDFKV